LKYLKGILQQKLTEVEYATNGSFLKPRLKTYFCLYRYYSMGGKKNLFQRLAVFTVWILPDTHRVCTNMGLQQYFRLVKIFRVSLKYIYSICCLYKEHFVKKYQGNHEIGIWPRWCEFIMKGMSAKIRRERRRYLIIF
jgi:hypothetical protein